MDRRSHYAYPRRSKPRRSYADDLDDDDEDDVVLASQINDSDDDIDDVISDTNDDDNDEDYPGPHHRQRHHPNTRPPRKQRRLYDLTPRATPRAGSDWSENSTFALLEIWGERFLQLGRSSLRNEDWNDVVERVSEATRLKLSVTECRNRLNSLKLRYKKEKAKQGLSGNGVSKWVYFKKMDSLMTMSPMMLQQQEQCGLACGVDSGEFVFMNPRVYLDHSNALDEMRDSPRNSEDEDSDDDDDDVDNDEVEGYDEVGEDEEESYWMLSESIKRVGEIYEKIEDSKREHMMELERMRVEFQRELEVQKKDMIDRTRAEIAKLSHGCDHEEDSGCSA